MFKKRQDQQDLVRAIPLTEIQERLIDLLDANEENAIADAVDLLVSQGAYHFASDIHLEAWTDHISLRYRIDGILQQVALIPRSYQAKLIARLKVLADLVVYRKDVPQDGRIDIEKTTCGRPMRISAVPTIRGEKIVIRILGDSPDLYNIGTLGFQPHVVTKLREIITRTQGTLLLTGPSSSGKTTTIYALLREMMSMQSSATNIVTIEDPVEYTMEKASQLQVNPTVEFTFANALRAILRQDPEVIMVGEIRDVETCKMAVQSGLTGHFVISTIHSGTAAGVFTRLLDMGIEPFLVASSVSGVLAQRLVRLNCPDCAQAYTPEPLLCEHFDLTGREYDFRKGEGCEACQGIGYRGRASIGELLEVDQGLSELVLSRPTTSQMHHAAVERGMEPLIEDGLKKAAKGITTLEELVRVMPTLI